MRNYTEAAEHSTDRRRKEYISIAEKLFDNPEIRFRERYASDLLMKKLEEEGFRSERGAGGLPTAFKASFGSGKPVIGFLGEYDALPGLSQEAGCSEKRSCGKDSGHACGHHLLGTGLLGAVIALKDYLKESGLPGTAVYYGCPAEEGGSGKVWMLREGVFDEADMLFTWHPDCINRVSPNDILATVTKEYYFHGIPSHAGAAPEAGRSALEAAELMAVGMGFLREHLPSAARVHYAYLDAGGSATNIVQGEAAAAYQIRSPRASEALAVSERIDDLARGAAIMTGTREEIRFQRASSQLRVNETLNDLLFEALSLVKRPDPDRESLALAERLRESLPENARGETEKKARAAYGSPEGMELAEKYGQGPLITALCPRSVKNLLYGVSTDVGDVSMYRPVGYLNTACFPKDVPLHSWQAASFGKSSFAMEGMLTAAKVIGGAAICLVSDPSLAQKAAAEWEAREKEEPYVCPIPGDAHPGIPEEESF